MNRFVEVVRLLGALARAGLAIIFLGGLLAIIIVIALAVLKQH